MQITPSLKLAFPIRFGDVQRPDPADSTKTVTLSEPLVWAYHTPISTEVFRANYRIIAATKAALFAKGRAFVAVAGSSIAALTLSDAARADAAELGIEDASSSFLAELKRLTLILAPSKDGFEQVPVDVALSRNVIDSDDWGEAESAIVFFTSVYALERRANRQTMGTSLALMIGGSMTLLGPTEYLASLQTSTAPETSAEPTQ